MGMGSRGGVIHFYPFVLLFLALTYNTCPSFSSSSKNHTHMCLPNQRDALLRFKNAYNITTWDEHVDCCVWDGIACDDITGDVIEVDASVMNLMGTISHITYLSPLYNLRALYLYHNHLYGVVPPELSHFSKLNTLALGNNQELTIESHSLKLLLQNLTQLDFLDLGEVKISGDLFNALVNISNALTFLSLDRCDSHGVLPESVFRLPNLVFLTMSQNIGLTVSFPTSNWSSPLQFLDLSSTNFSGKLPHSIGNLKNLLYLDLSSLHILNPLPSSFENLTQLAQLSLSSFARRDAVPSSFCRMSSLNNLYLSDNKFSGMIPQCLWNLTKLEILDLSYNQFTGLSPLSSNFTKIRFLDVTSNIINDTVTHWIQFLPNLIGIVLRENNFHGEIPLSICKSNASIVDLSNNRLNGTIPPCLIKNQNYDPSILNLRMNMLEGTIPNTFPLNCTTVQLDLSENRLEGPLPRSLVNCDRLIVLDLGNNSIEDSFPNWLKTLPGLEVLNLKFNKLHGEVKTLQNHRQFPNLRIFDISSNNFTGLLPADYIAQFDAMKDITNVSISKWSSVYLEVPSPYSYGYSTTVLTMKGSTRILPKVLNALKVIDLSNNDFYGEIPEIIGHLIALKGLNLSHNNLIGNIPPSIENMTSLEWLDLSSNILTGQIPNGFAQLIELESLNLSHNELTGMIPKGKQLDTFGKDSFVGNAGLCGSQIAVACGKPHAPQQPSLPYIQEDEFNVLDWKIILMGYACGLVIGLSIGYIVFEIRKPEWFVLLVEEKLLKKIRRSRWRENRLFRA